MVRDRTWFGLNRGRSASEANWLGPLASFFLFPVGGLSPAASRRALSRSPAAFRYGTKTRVFPHSTTKGYECKEFVPCVLPRERIASRDIRCKVPCPWS